MVEEQAHSGTKKITLQLLELQDLHPRRRLTPQQRICMLHRGPTCRIGNILLGVENVWFDRSRLLV
jgi:hypothetical protein